MAASVFAPWVPTYATYTPYITGQDFLNEPTGVDVSQLIPAGSNLSQEAALARLVANASSEADRICQQVLAATVDIEAGAYRVQCDEVSGLPVIGVPVKYTPLIEVSDVRVGSNVALLTSLPDLSGIRFERKVAWVPVPGSLARSRRVYAQMTYVNGFAHTLLAASVLAGASSITVKGALGQFPGLPMTVYDGASTEAVAIGASYVPGSTTIPLAAPLAYAHGAGVTVSALPPFARQAVVRLGAWLVKTRGAEAIVLDSITGQPSRTQQIDPGGSPDYAEAARALAPLARVW